MAITDEKKDLLLGKDSEELIKNADDNFTSLFDTVDDLDDAIKNSGFITKDVNNLTNYTVKGETGTDVELSIDNKTYVMTLNLKNPAGAVVSTATIDFPIESVVVNASYADGTLTLTLQNGNSVEVDISALVSGLVPDTRTVNGKNLKSNITLTQDDVGDGTTYKRYSATEKSKLAGIAEGANKYTHPSYTAKTSGLYKITVDATGHVSAVTAVTKADITDLGIPAQDTTYNDATESASGLMSASDKAKLNAIDESLKGVTADEIGKVKDVQVNGSTVLDKDTGIANIVINVADLKGNYVENITPTAVTLNSKSYKAIVVAETDVTLEVLNSSGQAVVTQVIRANGNIYYCLPSTDKNTYTLRKVGGNTVGGSGSSKRYLHWITLYSGVNYTPSDTSLFASVKFSEYIPECYACFLVNDTSTAINNVAEVFAGIVARAGKVVATDLSGEKYTCNIRSITMNTNTSVLIVNFYTELVDGGSTYFTVPFNDIYINDTVIEV